MPDPPRPPHDDVTRARIRYVDVSGLRIRTSVRGTGSPLLLMMGIGGNIEMWAPFERELAGSGIQTIAFDAPGTGQSTGWKRPRRMPALAELVDQVVEKLGYEQLDVLGVSFGGALAQQYVRQAPKRVRRLVLAATAAGMPGLGGVPGHPRTLLALATPRRYYSPEYLRKIAPKLYGGLSRREPTLLEERLRNPPSLGGYMAQMYAMQLWTSAPWLPFVRQPTLVLMGDDDPIMPVINGRILAQLIPRARLQVIHGGGHLFLIEEAAESAAYVREFLTGGEVIHVR